MARWLAPPPLPHHGHYRYIHDILATTFAVTCVAAIIAIVSTLCSSCHKKPKQKIAPKSMSSKHDSEFAAATAQILQLQENVNKNDSRVSQKEEPKVVELTPDVATHGPIPPAVTPPNCSKTSSIRRLSISLSKKLPDIMRNLSKKEKKDHHAAEPGEDMIWKKTIILGEKCKVPSDDEEEGGVKNYYPRTPRSRPISRANSFANNDVAGRTSSVAPSDLSLERRGE